MLECSVLRNSSKTAGEFLGCKEMEFRLEEKNAGKQRGKDELEVS